MRFILGKILLLLILCSCSNTPELETGEIKTFQLLKNAVENLDNQKVFIDSRKLLSRKQIDAAKIPVLFVELESKQNGTLTLYPGQGISQTWLGADGATVTLEKGILKATRGMGNDIMGAHSSMPVWSKIDINNSLYKRKISYITGNNKILSKDFECSIKKYDNKEVIGIWGIEFLVIRFEETCGGYDFNFKNTYYLDDRGIVRKSFQYHSNTIGYLSMERLDR